MAETPRRQLWAQIPSARSGVPSKGCAPTAAVNLSPSTTGPQQTPPAAGRTFKGAGGTVTRRVLLRPELSGRCRLWGGAGSCCLTLGPHWHECPGGRVPAWETGAFSLCSPAVSARRSRLRSWAGGSLGALTGTWAGGGPWTSKGLLVDQQHCPGPLPASHHMGAAVTCRC